VNWELNKAVYAKIIGERCELVKLCHSNRSGPVFLRHCVDSSKCSVSSKLTHLETDKHRVCRSACDAG